MPTTKTKRKPKKVWSFADYQAAFQTELDQLLALMRDTWGAAPNIIGRVDPCVMVSADFNMKGFAHKGGRQYVHAGNMHRRTPQKTAQQIVAEVLFHRNTCKECGEPGITLRERYWLLRDLLDPTTYTYRERGCVKLYGTKNNPQRSAYNCKRGNAGVVYTIEKPGDKGCEFFIIPPDPVERRACPTLSRKVDVLLLKYHAAVDEWKNAPKPLPEPKTPQEVAERHGLTRPQMKKYLVEFANVQREPFTQFLKEKVKA